MAHFEIESYTVESGQGYVILFLMARPDFHGAVHEALLRFSSNYTRLMGVVSGVETFSYVHKVSALFPLAEFDRMYGILRSEAPVSVLYHYAPGTTPSRTLLQCALFTGVEPPGEGFADLDAVEEVPA